MKRVRLKVFGRLDLYVGRLFLFSYLTAFFLVVGLYMILDMTANLDDYLQPDDDGQVPAGSTVALFYALQLPFLYLQVSPFVTLVAGLFTATKLARFNEVVAALNAGVSSRRVFAPVFLGAIVLGAGMLFLREGVTEGMGRRKALLLDYLTERREAPVYENFWAKDARGRLLRIGEFQPATRPGDVPEMRGISFRVRDGELSTAVHAQRAIWDSASQLWRLVGGQKVESAKLELRRTSVDVLGLEIRPEDIELEHKGLENPIDLSLSEVWRLLERDPSNTQYRTLFHAHLSFPLAGLVLLLVGLPFMVVQERGRAVERIAHGFLLCVGYFGADFVARTLGMQGQIGPVHAGWLPVLFFGSLGVVLYGSMRS